jgi:cytochrome P450
MRQLWKEMSGAGYQASEERCPTRDTQYPALDSAKSLGSLPKGEQLTLLDRVIKESMRLLPASAYSQRMNMVAVKLGPLFLPRGTGIVFTPLVTHHLPELYSQPETFLPDRWLSLRPSPYAYHPFGAGPRLCIGAPLATAIIRIALRRILSQYRLSVVPGSDVDVHVESTMLVPTNGLPMQIHAADGAFNSSPIGGNVQELVEFDEAPAFVSDGDGCASSGETETGGPRRPR